MVEQSMVGYGIWRGHPTKFHLHLQGVHPTPSYPSIPWLLLPSYPVLPQDEVGCGTMVGGIERAL